MKQTSSSQDSSLTGGPPPPPPPPPVVSAEARKEAARKEAEPIYNQCVAKGKERYKRIGPTSDPSQSLSRKQFLKLDHEIKGQDSVRITTRTDGGTYDNVIDYERGQIVAENNVKGKRDAFSSEYIFNQYDLAGSYHLRDSPLRTLVRNNVASASGGQVLLYLYGGENLNQAQEFTPSDDAFYALLGTENLACVAPLINDRGKELQISGIQKIVTTGTTITVHFTQ